MSTRPLLAILLPVRNGSRDLPAFLESVGRYADVVVALDDGSTDDTLAILAGHPLVEVVPGNPRRASYTGWNDAGNRNLLLAGAAALNPVWILSLDADERIDEADGRALREFLETDALPGLAYSFQVFSMQGEAGRYLPVALWVHRLFAFEPGQRFPARRLHFAPVPTSIPSSAYVRTTFRIQHLGGMSAERRQARYEKYRQADPDCRYWPDYGTLLDEPSDASLADWSPRSPLAPVLAFEEADDGTGLGTSMTVITPPGHPSLVGRDAAHEWIVSDSPDPLLDRALIERATGALVLVLPRRLVPRPGAIDELVAGHATGYALVAPAVDVPPEGDALDRRRYLPTLRVPEGGLLDAPPVWCSYRRSLLLETLGEVPPRRVSALNGRLQRLGYLCLQSSARFDVVPDTRVPGGWPVVAAFRDGRDAEATILDAHRLSGRRLRARRHRARGGAGGRPAETVALPRPLSIATTAGSLVEMLRPAPGKLALLLGRPQLTALWITTSGPSRDFLVVSWSQSKRTLRAVRVPETLGVERPDGTVVTLGEAIPRAGKINRFDLLELIGRPFSIPIDAYARVALEANDDGRSRSVRSAMAPTLRALSTIDTSLDRLSLALLLISARRGELQEIDPWASGTEARLDADTAELVAAFFAGHVEPDLGDPREQRRRVAWA